MKKSVLGLLIVVLILGVTGCNKENNNANPGNVSEEANKADGEVVYEVTDVDLDKIVTLAEYKGIVVNTFVSEEEIETEIQNKVQENPLFDEVTDRKVKNEDTVNIDFVGKMDGVEFEGGSAQGFDLVIGSGSFIEGFEDGLIGTKPGETVDLNLKFPDVYNNSPDLAGKDVVFTVTVNYIKGDEIEQEFNDEFVKRVTNGEYTTTDQYRDDIKNELYQSKVASMVDNAYLQIIENSTVSEVPQDRMNLMKARINASYQLMAEQNNYDDIETFISENFQVSMDEYNQELEKTAKAYVEQQLVTEAIAKKENISVTDEEYQEYLGSYLEMNGFKSAEEMEEYTLATYKSDLKSLVNEAIMLEKVLAIIGENLVEVNDKPEEK